MTTIPPKLAHLARLYGNPRLAEPLRLANGQFQLMFYGQDQLHYALEASSNLVNWVSITNFTATNNPMLLIDPSASSYPKRFYRAVALP